MQDLIVVVCRGNIGRSPFAEAVINQELSRRGLHGKFHVISRGVQGTAIDPEPVKFPNITYYKELYEDSKPTLDNLGIDLSKHTSTPINENDADNASILLALDDKTRKGLVGLFPRNANKIHLISELIGNDQDIIDPEGVSGESHQRQLFTDLRETIVTGFPTLLEILKQ